MGLLGLADGFVVTGDSISMMVEIARLGRPLAIFDLPTGRRVLYAYRDYLVAERAAAGATTDAIAEELRCHRRSVQRSRADGRKRNNLPKEPMS